MVRKKQVRKKEHKENNKVIDTKKKTMPVGMILILIVIAIGVLGLLNSILNPVFQIGPYINQGIIAEFYILVAIAINAMIFIGILKRLKWSRVLAIFWYCINMILSIINLLTFFINPSIYYNFLMTIDSEIVNTISNGILTAIIIFAIVPGLIIGLLILFYLIKKKDYFVK